MKTDAVNHALSRSESARSLMVLGTASHVGKSILTAALCRIFARSGVRVAPFKAQNMSLNSAATVDGCEIGRAQALQAEAAGIFATSDMNPVLLKPDSHRSCQIVVQGRVWKNLSADQYHLHRVRELFPLVLDSYRRLAEQYELIVLEGAGSPAEINLKETDIVNMRMAIAADAACLLVADIDRGGVFASLLGTLELLAPDERKRIHGFVINKFRGDLNLLAPGIIEIEQRLGKPCVGVVPYIANMNLDEEDSVGLAARYDVDNATAWRRSSDHGRQLRIAVTQLPYVANFTDFDSLASEPGVSLRFVQKPEQIEHADVIILPGTKQTIQDMRWLRDSGLAEAISNLRNKKLVIGICGGFQMMGLSVGDPHGMEGGGRISGLGILQITSILAKEKITSQVSATLIASQMHGVEVTQINNTGYEIHLGETTYHSGATPMFELRRSQAPGTAVLDGAHDSTGCAWGTYMHGLFDQDSFRHMFLKSARYACGLAAWDSFAFPAAERQEKLDRLADSVEQALDINAIRGWLSLPVRNADGMEMSRP